MFINKPRLVFTFKAYNKIRIIKEEIKVLFPFTQRWFLNSYLSHLNSDDFEMTLILLHKKNRSNQIKNKSLIRYVNAFINELKDHLTERYKSINGKTTSELLVNFLNENNDYYKVKNNIKDYNNEIL